MNNSPVLSVQKLAKTYSDGIANIQVLKDINLNIVPGEMVAVVGASGSGKSTLLHLLGGLDQPTDGAVYLNGKNFHTLGEKEKCRLRNHCLGFVYQFHHLLPEFSALENVGMPLLIKGVEPKEIRGRSEVLLEQVGLQDRMYHRLGQLSGGERQRVAIARALVANPLCVLADEPTGNLDPRNAERVLEMFFGLQRAHQTSVVMVTHDVKIAQAAQRIFRIEDGELIPQARI